MAILLLGHWDTGGALHIDYSRVVDEEADQAVIEALVDTQDSGDAWAATFPVSTHRRAVQEAYDEYVIPGDGDTLVDDVEGFEPETGPYEEA